MHADRHRDFCKPTTGWISARARTDAYKGMKPRTSWPSSLQFMHQRADDIGEAAGFGVRHDLGTQDAQLERIHRTKSSKARIHRRKKLVRLIA